MMITRVTPAAGDDHPVAHVLVGMLADLRPIAGPAGARLWQLGQDRCLTTMLTLLEVEAAFAAVKLHLLGVMEEDQVTRHTTELGTADWINDTTAASLAAAHRDVALAKCLHRRFPATLTAMAAGAVSQEQAAAIVGVLKKLPESLPVEKVNAAEKMMIGFAEVHGPKGLRDLATYLLNVIAPEVAEESEAAALEAQDRAARKTQYLRLRDDGDGCTSISGKLPAADGEALRAVAGPRGCSPATYAKPSPSATRDVCSPGCHREPRDCDATTSDPGPEWDRPAWTTPPWSAPPITG